MRPPRRLRTAALVASALCALAWAGLPLLAQRPPSKPDRTIRPAGGFGVDELALEDSPATSAHVVPRVTERMARAWVKLYRPISLDFPRETPLEDVLKHIIQATRDKGDKGIAMYIDPVGLSEAERTMQSPVSIKLDDIPAATALALVLDQLGLSFHVKEDGLVVVSYQDGPAEPYQKASSDLWSLHDEVAELRNEVLRISRPSRGPATEPGTTKKAAHRRIIRTQDRPDPAFASRGHPTIQVITIDVRPRSAKAARTWLALQEPVAMNFANETPLEDVLKYITTATRGPDTPGITLYVDPVGLNEAEKTMTSPVILDIEGVPLATTLTLLLRQLGLTYEVMDDGLIRIKSEGCDQNFKSPVEILDVISDIRMQVQSLRGEVAAQRGGLR